VMLLFLLLVPSLKKDSSHNLILYWLKPVRWSELESALFFCDEFWSFFNKLETLSLVQGESFFASKMGFFLINPRSSKIC
jgi:hypothetical protein